MNLLTPPPQRDLPEAVRREIHADLVRTSRATPRARHRGRLVAPALALTGAVGVAAAVGLLPHGSGLPGVGVPAPAGPVPTSTAMPDRTAGSSPVPAAESIDRGPLSSATADEIIKSCLHGSPGGGTVARVHIARQTSIAGGVVVLTDTAGILHLCRDGMDVTGPPLDAGGPLGDIQRPSPTPRRPVVQLTGYAGSGSAPGRDGSGAIKSTDTSYYRVGPDVASLQVRLSVDGHTGPWVETIMADGYAWAGAFEDHPVPEDGHASDSPAETHVDDRAFDAAGHELDIDRVTR